MVVTSSRVVVSGIDPIGVMSLLNRINYLGKRMEDDLNKVNGEIASKIKLYYRGHAADALLDKIKASVPILQDEMKRILSVMNENIDDDLDDAINTDNALAG